MVRQPAVPVLVAALVVAVVYAPSFFSSGNLRTVALQASVLGVVALGQTLVLLVRGIDMSVSAVAAFSGVLVVSAGDPDVIAVFLAVAAGISVLVGLANGVLVTWRNVPPFVATFVMLIVVGGIRLAYTQGRTSGSAPEWLRQIGSGSLFGVPFPVVVWAALTVALWLALTRSRWGRAVYATGSNREAARHSGIPVGAVTISAYILSALCAMVAGLLLAGYLGYVDQNLGVNLNLNSIAAAIVGGVAFTGGRGTVWGAALGAILLTVLVNVVVVAGLAAYWQLIIIGAVLIAAVAAQGVSNGLALRPGQNRVGAQSPANG